ncbi:hypothetical protein LNQ81_08370 [Myroides sp. M-43]|uniref:hypothetical protein n=1 Tax=Myroides oncorhynchi TaxID=2893756 RepID=UPI001E497808|nr:hypothetical protein [Myroides oncorhynchi]MCC9042704.1 hypothetical protein [Myroides oncorhynchi]
MKKSVQVAMLLGVITLSMVSCDKDDNQLQIKKEVKANGVDEQEVDHDWGYPPIKPPKINNRLNSNYNEQESLDWGYPPIKPPKINKHLNSNYSEQESLDWGYPPIKPPKK